MKKSLSILFLIISFNCFSQTLTPTTTPGVTNRSSLPIEDKYIFARQHLGVPRYADSIQATIYGGIDTCGAIFYSYAQNAIFFRSCDSGRKHWVMILPQGGGAPVAGQAWINPGNNYLFTDVNNNGIFGTLQANGVSFKTNNAIRFTLPDNGIKDNSSAAVKYLGVDTTGGGFRPLAFASAPSSVNIYNNNGTLTGDRILTGAAHNLSFTGLNSFSVDGVDDMIITSVGAGGMTNNIGALTGGSTLESLIGNRNSTITVSGDTTFFYPSKGIIKIDTLALAGSATNKQLMTWDNVTKFWEQIPPSSIVSGNTWQQSMANGNTSSIDAILTGSANLQLANRLIYPDLQYNATATTHYGQLTNGNRVFTMRGDSTFKSVIGANAGANYYWGQLAGNLTSTGGGANIGLGDSALNSVTSAYGSVAIGEHALQSNTTGPNNISIGAYSQKAQTTNGFNVAVGVNSLTNNTAAGLVGVGYNSLTLNTTGTFNTAVGNSAMAGNTTGSFNTAFGADAMRGTTTSPTGSYNVGIGGAAIRFLTSGEMNTAFGYHAGHNTSSGRVNLFGGQNAGENNTSGSSNTFLGHFTAHANTTGSFNTAIGDSSMYLTTTGNNNTYVGYATHGASADSNNTSLGANGTVTGSGGIWLFDGLGNNRMQFNSSGALSIAASFGTSGYILQTNGTGSAPTWVTPTIPTLQQVIDNSNTATNTGIIVKGSASPIVATGVGISSAADKVLTLNTSTGASLFDFSAVTSSKNFAFPNTSGTIALVGGTGVGTVTSVATGLGLSGGTITSTGTIIVDTSSVSILSRQRAVNTYLALAGGAMTGKINVATGTTSLAPIQFTNGAPTTSLGAGNLMFNTGLLILDSTASHRDTLATRNYIRNNTSASTPGIDNVLAAGNTLSTNRTIDAMGFDFVIGSPTSFSTNGNVETYSDANNTFSFTNDAGNVKIGINTSTPSVPFESVGDAFIHTAAYPDGLFMLNNAGFWSIGDYGDKINGTSISGDDGGATINMTANNGYTLGGGSVTISNLSGIGTRGVTASSSGVLGTTVGTLTSVVASADSTALSATDANVTTYTPASDGSYQVLVYSDITAISAATLTITCIYTDTHSNTRTTTFYGMGTTTAGIGALGSSNFPPVGLLRVKGGTAITVVSTFTGVSITYDVSAKIISLQ